MRAFPQKGRWFTSLGRGNMQLLPGVSNTELLVLLAITPLGGPALGVARGVALRGLNIATKPIFWGAVNLYQEATDLAAWMKGEDMSWQLTKKWRPVGHPVFGSWGPGIPFIPIPFPYLDFTKSPSSGVGGPGEIPNLHRPPPSIEEIGEILSNPPMAGGKTGSPKPRARGPKGTLIKCPVGYYWDKRTGRCLKSRKKG